MINLIFKILADATGFNRTLNTDLPNEARKGGKKAGKEGGAEFGKEFGNQVKGAVMSAVGAGAILGAIKQQISQAAKLTKDAAKEGIPVEAMQELQRASEATGMTVDEIRKAAPEVASQFIAMMEAIRASGGIVDSDTVQKLSDLDRDLKNMAASMAVVISPIAKIIGATLELLTRFGRVVGASAVNLAGVVMGNEDMRQGGLQEITSAMTTPLKSLAAPEARIGSASETFTSSAAQSARLTQATMAARTLAFTSRVLPLTTTAGGDRAAAMASAIPGATGELLSAIRENTRKMEEMKQSVEKKL